MEAFGREYRMMAEGLMQLLRMRAEEKGNARIAQTVVSASRVNPFKFMPTVDDALAVLTAPPSGGFSDAGTAISGAVRDLAAHQVRTWRGTQAALRRMIDRFSPDALEKELEALGLLETLLAGGRRAKLWELYEKRFRDIARSAETRFLGEVGADFREAYETEEE
jgi:type VI secretion system protein ImpI